MSQWHCTAGGTKYGPVELDVLRQWLNEGRVKPADLVWTEGMAEWQPASTVVELQIAAPGGIAGASALPSADPTAGSPAGAATDPFASAGAPASAPSAASSPAAFGGQPGIAGAQPGYYPAALPNAPGAVTGMVCGIIGAAVVMSCFGGIASLILGIVALQQSKKAKATIAMYPGSYGGAGMATAGYVLGIVSIILGILCILYLVAVIGMAITGNMNRF